MSKVAWTPEEDMKLIEYIKTYGACNWKLVSEVMRINRDGKSCRERWVNHLNPTIKKGEFSEEEKQLVSKYHDQLGNRWSLIAAKIPGRSDNDIKNFWNSMQRRKQQEAKQEPNSSAPSSFSYMASTSHPCNNPCRPSSIGLFNTRESQPVRPVPTYANQHLGILQSNNKDTFLNYGLHDSVPLPCIWMNSHPKMEQSLIQSLPVFTITSQTIVSTTDWRRTSNNITTSTDNNEKFRSVQKEGMKNIIGDDELMSLIGSSSSNGQLPEWSDLGH